jgi:hypothetical protein
VKIKSIRISFDHKQDDPGLKRLTVSIWHEVGIHMRKEFMLGVIKDSCTVGLRK